MPLLPECLPRATPLDPAEDPPGSIDPLGTLGPAERLAEVLLPGFTARMWRVRLLTFSAVNVAIADRVVALMAGREEVRLEARLTFERLFVSAVIRMHECNPETYGAAKRRLPGSDLARAALAASEPLTRNNFLKGQAVNGPCGVMARLARNLELVDGDWRRGRNAPGLILAWSQDRGLPGVLDEEGPTDRPGSAWATDVVKTVAKCLAEREWPGPGHKIWERLAIHLRPDEMGAGEKNVLARLLEGSEVRLRILSILRQPENFRAYHSAIQNEERGGVERYVLTKAVRPTLKDGPVDRLITIAIKAIDSYEQVAALLQEVFNGVLWGLTRRGGRADPDTLLEDSCLRKHLDRVSLSLRRALPLLDRSIGEMREAPVISDNSLIEPIAQLRDDAVLLEDSQRALLGQVLGRHERVQRDKRKAAWLDRARQWTLMPGFGIGENAPPELTGAYLHPFRIPNAYSLLADLGQVPSETSDVEA